MAAPSNTVWGSTYGNYARLGIAVTPTTNDATQYAFKIEIWVWSKYSLHDSANTLYYTMSSSASSATDSKGAVSIYTTVDSGGGWSTSNQQKVWEYTHAAIAKGTAAQTRYLYAKITDVANAGTMYVSTTVSIPTLASYTISYNANGGTGAPASQTKWHGKSLTLSNTTPKLTGHTFLGWETSNDSDTVGPDYYAGDTYTVNANDELYAVFQADTYAVKYNANGGTNAPDQQTKTYGKTLKLSSSVPKKENYNFLGWGVAASSTTVSYAAGADYTTNAAITLYAVWQIAYTKPKITNFSVARCDANNKITDTGKYALIEFDWSTFENVKEIILEWTSSAGNGSKIFTASGKSGNISEKVGDNALSTEYRYDFVLTVTDSESSTAVRAISGTNFPIDVLAGGNGVAFGEPAFEDGFRVNYDAKFRKTIKTEHGETNKESWFESERTDTGNKVCIGVGSGGVNRGLWANNIIPATSDSEYDHLISKDNGWLIYAGSDGYVKSQRAQKVLWSGIYYMTEGHTAKLSESIDKQLNGIVLVFSPYIDGVAVNYYLQTFFIPKQLIFLSGAAFTTTQYRMTFTLFAPNMQYAGTKYLLISNTQIDGTSYNNSVSTGATGIKYENNKWVLRYVIGV